MKFCHSLLGKRKKRQISSVENPYLLGSEGRQEWNDRYFNMTKHLRFWQWAFLAAMLLSASFGWRMVHMAMHSRIQPYVVETHQGQPYAIHELPALNIVDERIINYAVNQFIINAKSVVLDTAAQKTLLTHVYAFSADSIVNFLDEHYEEHNPFKAAERYSVAVTIINAMPLSPTTWQVTWDEERRDFRGDVLGTERWMANVTFKFDEVNPKYVTENPFGFYITQLSWSKNKKMTRKENVA